MKTFYDLEKGVKITKAEKKEAVDLTDKAWRILANVYKEVLPIILQEVAEFEVFEGLNPKVMLTGRSVMRETEIEEKEDGFYNMRTSRWGVRLSPSQAERVQLPLLIPRPEKYNPIFLELLSKFHTNENKIREHFIGEINNRIWQKLQTLQEFYGCDLFAEIEEQFLEIANEINVNEPRITICKNLSFKIELHTPKKLTWVLIKC